VIARELGNQAAISQSEASAELRFTTDRDDSGLSALLAHLLDAGVRVAQFREIPMDLEDAFLSVTGQSGAKPSDAASVPQIAREPQPGRVGAGA